MEIRDLSDVGDPDLVVSLFATVDPEGSIAAGVPADGIETFLADPSSFLVGAYVEDEPVGLAWGLQMRYPSGRLTTYLHQSDVSEDHRRRGIGSALVRAAMDLGRRRGADRFWLSTGRHNEVAQSVYESLGGDRKPLGDVNYWWSLD